MLTRQRQPLEEAESRSARLIRAEAITNVPTDRKKPALVIICSCTGPPIPRDLATSVGIELGSVSTSAGSWSTRQQQWPSTAASDDAKGYHPATQLLPQEPTLAAYAVSSWPRVALAPCLCKKASPLSIAIEYCSIPRPGCKRVPTAV